MAIDKVTTGVIADDAVTTAKIVNDAVTAAKIPSGAVVADVGAGGIGTTQLAADAVDGTKLADNAVNSEHYTDGSIDLAHLSADSVDGTKIADNAIDSEHYADGSIDEAHIAADAINFATHLKAGTDGELITWDASGNPAAVAVGTSGRVLTSGGAGVAPTFQTGGWTKLAAVTASGTASSVAITGYFTSDYTIYKLFGYEMYNTTDNTVFYAKFRNTSGDLTASAYRHLTGAMYTNSSAFYRGNGESVRGWSDGQFRVQWNAIDNTGGYSMDMEMTIVDPLSVVRYPMAHWDAWHNVFDLTLLVNSHGVVQYANTDSPIAGISFFASSGNIKGKFLLYGLKN